MKKLTIAALVSLGLGAAAFSALADDRRGIGMFERADLNADGNVSKDEIATQRAERFASADTSGDNLVSPEEFEAFAIAEREQRAAERRARQFANLDTNGDGLLTAEEHASAGADRMDKMFDRIDADGDGVISDAERDAAAEKMRERRGKRGMGRRG
ncbi:MAG: calcium-binding protein [Pseudomonadota bacterium]